MRIAVNTRIARDFRGFLNSLQTFNFNCIELDPIHINRENLEMLEQFKTSVIGICSRAPSYAFHLHLAQSFACEYVCFPLPIDEKKLEAIREKSEQLGIRVGLENAPGMDERKLLAEIRRKEMKLVLNLANLYEAVKMPKRDFIAAIEKLKKDIIAIKVSDFCDGFSGLPIGLGEIDFKRVVKELREMKVPWIIDLAEHYSLIDAYLSKNKLSALFKQRLK